MLNAQWLLCVLMGSYFAEKDGRSGADRRKEILSFPVRTDRSPGTGFAWCRVKNGTDPCRTIGSS